MEIITSDILIIGAGGSGLAASAAAAGRGAKVRIIDKRRTPGGTMNMLAGLVAADSPTQKRAGIDISADDLFLTHMRYSHWSLDPYLVRTWLDRSGETVRWLEGKGVQFRMFSMFTDEPPTSWHWGLRMGADIVKALLKECQDLGVEFSYETRAVKLLRGASGEITGVSARSNDEDIEFRAKAVIIATGGYGGNRDMMTKYCPGYSNPLPAAGIETAHTGDGIQMAFEAGADSEGLGNLLLCGPCFVGGFGVFHLAIEPTTIWVNTDGRRFIEEGLGCSPFEAPNAMLRQPEQVCFSIFDEATLQQVIEHGYIRPDAHTVSPVEKLAEAMQENLKKGTLISAPDIAGLAEKINIDKETLAATVERYNRLCDAGHDADFAKLPEYLKALRHPPFYAAKCYPSHLGSVGGIKINERMEVLDKNRTPIRGLWAVGSDTGGWSSSTYNRYLAGAGASYAINSGLIGGENAAAFSGHQAAF